MYLTTDAWGSGIDSQNPHKNLGVVRLTWYPIAGGDSQSSLLSEPQIPLGDPVSKTKVGCIPTLISGLHMHIHVHVCTHTNIHSLSHTQWGLWRTYLESGNVWLFTHSTSIYCQSHSSILLLPAKIMLMNKQDKQHSSCISRMRLKVCVLELLNLG